ncbi:MAG: PPC domain-containing protein [Candidatus Hydrogenedentes bacterium]|nr:PPC domain-containing protein [Candidatus Hydrogenedentota bacterium]
MNSACAASPALGQILPRGGARGSQPEILFQGGNLDDAVDIVFHEPGIKLTNLAVESASQVRATLEIAPDCPVGLNAMRVRTRSGISNLLLFSVGALEEADEQEPNDDKAAAPVRPLGVTINGTITSEDVDYFAVELEAGARLSAEIEALRLGGPLFDPKLRLFGPGGHELVAEDDTQLVAQDAAFAYTAEQAGRHVVAVSEAAYGGGGEFRYRLHLGQFPRPLMVTPLGGLKSAACEVSWLGDPGITTQNLTLPEAVGGIARVAIQNELGVAPSPFRMRVGGLSGVRETEPNNTPEQASSGAVPGAFDGVLAETGDEDWFQFPGKKDTTCDLRVWARELGSPVDSILTVMRPGAGNLAEDDDGAGIDSAARVTFPEDATYALRVRDHLGRGGPLYAYRVEATPVTPRLEVNLAEDKQAGLALPQGDRALVLLSVRREEIDGPVKVEFTDLPAGVAAECDVLPAGQSTFPVVFTAAADAPVSGALTGIVATLSPDGQAPVTGGFRHKVALTLGNNLTVFWAWEVERLALAVTEPSPFSISLTAPKVPVVRNGAMDLKVTATRKEGFTAPIDLRIPFAPSGVGVGTAQIPAEATETTIHIEANGGAPVGIWKVPVLASAVGYQVCAPLTPIEVAEPWVTFAVTPVETEQNKPVEVAVTLAQAHEYTGSYEAQLLGLPKGVTTSPQSFSRDTTELRFPLSVAQDAPAGKHEGLFVRAVLQADGEPILHQSGGGRLVIYEPLPAELQQAPAPEPAKPETPQPEAEKPKTRFAKG